MAAHLVEKIIIRVPSLMAVLIDQHAAQTNSNRSDWIREAILLKLQQEGWRVDLANLEKRLMAHLDELKAALIQHVTNEIDDLTHG
jgi:metal-responsive CopG/Arc/MetJ family transcriptional regulator